MTDNPADPLLPADPVDFDTSSQFGPAVQLPVEFDDNEPDETKQADTDLDERARQDFTGLLYLGYLEEECVVAGHRFLLRTPSQDDRLEMGFVHKPYLNTMSTEPAWQMIYAAAYLRRIDETPAPEPLSDTVSGVRTRFEWIKKSITSPYVVGLIAEASLALSARERAVVEHLDDVGELSA